MGLVYEVLDRRRNEKVALKFLPQAAPAALFAFKREFRTLAGVSHPHLVGLYELFAEGEQWFFTMELVDGVNLREFVLDDRAPTVAMPDETRDETAAHDRSAVDTDMDHPVVASGPERGPTVPTIDDAMLARLRPALAQLAVGLIVMHTHGVLHRDLKSPNVMVRRDGRVVLLDFGLATGAWASGETAGVVSGTASYMSPEQAAGDPLTPATDWYSVGVILYEMLTGVCPFAGSVRRILSDKKKRDPVPPRALNPTVPEDLERLTIGLLNRDPAARYSGPQVLQWCADEHAKETAAVEHDAVGGKPHFVGRFEQLRALESELDRVRNGATAVLLVRGESGVGKTALVQRFLSQLPPSPPPLVLSGRCYEQESVPFKAFDSLIDTLSRQLEALSDAELATVLPRDIAALTRIFPVLERIPAVAAAPSRTAAIPDQIELRRRGFAALRELLARLGDRHLLVLLLDDLQWGDLDSANLFNELVRTPDPPVMMVLGTYRAEDERRSECLRQLGVADATAGPFRILPLATLSRDESIDLALRVLNHDGADERAVAEQIVRESGGSPYLLSELAHHVRDGVLRHPELAAAEPHAADVRVRLDDALGRRIEALPSDARAVLEVLSVAGRPLGLSDLLNAANIPDSHGALSQLRNDRFLRVIGAGKDELLSPYHDRIRETCVARLPADAIRERHRSLARALLAGEADAQTLAIHHEGAGEHDAAGRYYAAAAEEAARALAFEQAANLYRKSLALRPLTGAERRDLVTRLAEALASAGRGREAAEQFLAASALADADRTLMLKGQAGFNYCAAGDIDSGRQALAAVLDELGMPLPKSRVGAVASLLRNRLRLWWRGAQFRERSDAELSADERMRLDVTWQVATGLFVIDTIRGTDFATRNHLMALRAGEPFRIARAVAWEAAQSSMEGVRQTANVQRCLDTAAALAGRLNQPYPHAISLMGQGISQFFLGRWRDSTDSCDRAAAAFAERCAGVAWELSMSNAFAYWSLFWSGDFAEIQRRYPRLIAEAEQRSDRLAVANITTFAGPFAFLSQDDPEAAATALAGAMGQWSKQDFHTQHFTALSARTYVELYRGNFAAAWDNLTAQWAGVKAAFLMRVEIVRIYLHHLRACAALAAAEDLRAAGRANATIPGAGRHWSVRALEAEAAAYAKKLERERAPYGPPLALPIRAALAGRSPEACDHLRAACRRLNEIDAKMFAAAAQYQLGGRLGGDAGRRERADAERIMRQQNIVRPDRIADLLVPGFRPLEFQRETER